MSEFAKHLVRSTMCAGFAESRSTFLIYHAIVEDLPHEPAQPMSNGSDCLGMAQSRDKPSVEELEDAPLGLHRGIRGLIQHATHLAIAVGRSPTVVDAGALIGARATTRPPGD